MSRAQGGGFPSPSRGPQGGAQSDRAEPVTNPEPVFDPQKPLAELVDTLAERQAKMIVDDRDELNSSQLRRFFGDIKSLYWQLEQGTEYTARIEPRFKMMRSKAAYARRSSQSRQSKIPERFFRFIDDGVKRVRNQDDFRAFVQHFEAVVGFLYGSGKVGK